LQKNNMTRRRMFLPPAPQVEANRARRSCLFEQPSQAVIAKPVVAGQRGHGAYVCPYEQDCERTAALLPLDRMYGEHVKVTLTEPSSSIVVRSEHQYNHDERRRLSLRKHLFESNDDCDISYDLSHGLVEAVIESLTHTYPPPTQWDQIRKSIHLLAAVHVRKRRSQVRFTVSRDELLREIQVLRVQFEPQLTSDAWDKLLELVLFHAGALLRCRGVSGNEDYGRYLGFVDVRLRSQSSGIAMGLLVPPRRVRHDINASVIIGEYAALFGASSFASSIYTTHDPEHSGARCAQACIIMALALLSDRGANIIGSFTVTFLAKQHSTIDLTDDVPADCLSRTCPEGAFRISGLTFDEIHAVLNLASSRTSADAVLLRQHDFNHYRAMRLIDAYITARCPIVLLVNSRVWWQRLQDRATPDRGHAVLIVGVRRSQPFPSAVPRVMDLIVHDPGLAPFCDVSATDAFMASSVFCSHPDRKGFIHLMPVAEEYIKRHAHSCLQVLENRFYNIGSFQTGEEERICFEDALYWSHYSSPGTIADGTTDYTVYLVHRDDLIARFLPSELASSPVEQKDVDGLRQSIDALPSGWYWTIAGYAFGMLKTIWVFRAEDASTAGDLWDRRIRFGGGGGRKIVVQAL
jgi:hypothetical protein